MLSLYTRPQWFVILFNAINVVAFGGYYLSQANYEFFAYAVTIIVVTILLFATLSLSRFPTYLLLGVAIWGLLHMLGGSVQTPDGVLYAWKIYPFFDGGGDFYILKMDQVVHGYLYGVVGLMFFHLLRNVAGVRTHVSLVAGSAIFASAGFSIINEVIEFLATVSLPETGVGGYENTVLDLMFNLSGATIAVLMAAIFSKNSEET